MGAENTGKVAEVVQLHIECIHVEGIRIEGIIEGTKDAAATGELAVLPRVFPACSHAAPIRSIAGVQLALAPRRFNTVSADGRRIAGPGAFEISVRGGKSCAASASLRIGGAAKERH